MKYVLLVWVALAAWVAFPACTTERNPDVCCTTDADCAQLGIPPAGCPDGFVCRSFTCVAASCAADSDCGSDAPVCNLTTAACEGCTASSDCESYADSPVCDAASGACRACQLDAECASEVCDVDTGRCVDEADVVYAAPDGPATAPCTHASPCSTTRALELVTSLPEAPLIRMLPGLYTEPIVYGAPREVHIVATDATFHSMAVAMKIHGGARVEIRGLRFAAAIQSLWCEGTAAAPTSVTFVDVSLETLFQPLAHCSLTMLRSKTTVAFVAVSVDSDATFVADRVLFGNGGSINTLGARIKVRVTNSVFEGGVPRLNNTDAAPDQSEFHFAFNTFVFTQTNFSPLGCGDESPRTAVFENNVFVRTVPGNVIGLTGACTFSHNITYPQSPGLGGANLAEDPLLVDAANGDYRLMPSSPAVDAAGPTSISDLDHDFAGTPRPQGAKNDIGGFELVP